MITTRNIALDPLLPVELTIDTAIDSPNSISVQNTSNAGFAYIGNANVSTTSYGFRVHPSQTVVLELDPYDKLYAVGDSGTAISVLILDRP